MMDCIESLKENCLSVIVRHFEQYYAAFEISEGSVFEKQFEYLERVFSETLFHRLISCGELKEKYFKLLINRHVRHLDLADISENLLPAVVDQLRNINTSNIVSLKAIYYNNFLSGDQDLYKQLISLVPNLEDVAISEVNTEVLEEIGKRCPLLKVLKILNGDVNDDELMKIFMNINGEYEDKVNLEQLVISSTMVTHIGVSFVLSHAPSLKCLEYYDVPGALYKKHKNDLDNNCIEELNKYSLSSLSFIQQENMFDTLKICTTLCPDISSLSVVAGLENDEQLLLCSKFHHLKDVKIHVAGNPFSYESLAQFLKLRGRGLLSFQLENGCASVEAVIESCPKLRSLKLDSLHYKPLNQTRYLFSKAKLPCLKTLAITHSEFSIKETADSVELILSNAKNITSVNFSGARGLTENFFNSMVQLGLFRVRELNLSFSDIIVPPLVKLLSHGNLQKLNVSYCINITETEYFDLLSCIGDNNVTIIFQDDMDEIGSFSDPENEDYDFLDDQDDYYISDYDEYLHDDFDYYDDDYSACHDQYVDYY